MKKSDKVLWDRDFYYKRKVISDMFCNVFNFLSTLLCELSSKNKLHIGHCMVLGYFRGNFSLLIKLKSKTFFTG